MRILLLLLLVSPTFGQNAKDFPRFTYEQMTNLASPTRLSHRLFYKASKGPDALWFDTVKKGDLAKIKQMVNNGQNIEAKDTANLGQTALLWSAFLGYLDITKYLIEEKNANLFATDRADVQHVFKSAILGGDIKTIEYLYPKMKNDIDINAQDERDGETGLMVAVGNDRVDAVNFLIKNGADVSIVSKQLNHNALSFACRANNKKMISILQAEGAINQRTGTSSCK